MTKAVVVESAEKTPPRSSLHNVRSPIASIKRPRAGKSPMRGSTANETSLSPLHPPRQPTQGDVVTDALFSPVLHFDHHIGNDHRDEYSYDADLHENDTEPTSPSTIKESPNS